MPSYSKEFLKIFEPILHERGRLERQFFLEKLYHGSVNDNIQSILQQGFLVSKLPLAGRTFGDGIYATNSIIKAAVHAANLSYIYNHPYFFVGEIEFLRKVNFREILTWDYSVHEKFPKSNFGHGMYYPIQYIYGTRVAAKFQEYAIMHSHYELDLNSYINIAALTYAARESGYLAVKYKNSEDSKFSPVIIIFSSQIIRLSGIRLVAEKPLKSWEWESSDWYQKAIQLEHDIENIIQY